jgi:hypothetical protein
LKRLGNPTAAWYAHHLANFRSDPTPLTNVPTYPTSSMGANSKAIPPRQTSDGPSMLRMALTAAKSMAAFVGSGFKATSSEAYRARLTICAKCEHHTGVRCRICGCITAAKAKMLHEKCPAGRWLA